MDTLHPNLARVAATYDDLATAVSDGRLDEAEARQRASRLVARDDQGVRWWLSPDNGAWHRETQDGRWEQAEPPTYGIPTVSPHDVSAPGRGFDPTNRVLTSAVSNPHDLVGELTGATWAAPSALEAPRRRRLPSLAGRLPALTGRNRVIAAAVGAVLALLVVGRCSHQDSRPTPQPTPRTSVGVPTTAPDGRPDMPLGPVKP